GSTKIIKYIVELTDIENELVIQSDSAFYSDTLQAGDTLIAYDLLMRMALIGDFAEHYIEKRRFMEGYYNLKILFYDSNHVFLNDSSVKFIHIIDDQLPALISPLDLVEVQDSQLNSTVFQWTKAKKATYENFYYYFKLYEINDSSDILDLENGFNYYPPIYQTTIYNDTSLVISFLYNLLDTNKLYAWSVKTHRDVGLLYPFVANKGISQPYIIKPSKYKRGVQCVNPDLDGFENGTLSGWVCYYGTRQSAKDIHKINYNASANPISGRHEIVNSYIDQKNMKTVPDNGGSYALRLGSPNGDGNVQAVTKTFFVTAANSKINIRYAAVFGYFEGHQNDVYHQPYVEIIVYASRSLIAVPVAYLQLWAGKNDNFTTIDSNVSKRAWDCEVLDLSGFIGSNVTIQISNGPCNNNNHWVYTYIDFCGSVDSEPSISSDNNFCIGDSIEFDGSASSNYTTWKYSVQSCNSSQTVFYGDSVESDLYINTDIPSSISINDLINKTGYKCGYFKVILYTKSKCSEWQSESKLIYISCPALGVAGPDICCPGGVCNVQIGTTGNVSNTYSWSPSDCLSSSTVANPYFYSSYCIAPPTFPRVYTLTVTDQYGCSSSDEMTFHSNSPNIDTVLQTTVLGCAQQMILVGSNYSSIDWNWLDSEVGNQHYEEDTIIVPGRDYAITLELTLNNSCGTDTTSFYIPPRVVFQTRALKIGATQAVSHPNGIFGVQDMSGPSFGAPNAYFASTEIVLEVFDRNGGIWVVYEHHGSTINNGDIRWDCKINGKPLANGIYIWRLGLKNCFNINSHSYEYVHLYYTECTEWGKLRLFPWPPSRPCTKGDDYEDDNESQVSIEK
ncbi:MAG TPA: hypothetical protein VGF79_11730, partial [Bacteroidia bacterium]